jgi:predicted nucleic acid-binding protein
LTKSAVVNSTCLIALEGIERLNLLRAVYGEVIAPPAVLEEVAADIDWLVTKEPANPAVSMALQSQLGKGEAAAIALAIEMSDVVIILDDKKARRVARQMGLKVVGTLGTLLRAKRLGIIVEVQPILEELKTVGFRYSTALYNEVLRLSGEEAPN